MNGDQYQELERKLEDLKEQVRLKTIDKARQNVINWAKYFLPNRFTVKSIPDMHVDLARAIENQESKYFTGPRGYGKSQVATIAHTLYLACEHEKFQRNFIEIITSSPALCYSFVRQIRDNLERNERIRDQYGSLVGRPWKEGHLRLSNGVEIRAIPFLSSHARGEVSELGRPDVFILDDAETYRNVRTENAREMGSRWYNYSLLPSADSRRPPMIYMFGTMLSGNCLLAKEMKDRDGQTYVALGEDNKSTWEDQITTAYLRDLQRRNPLMFKQEYQGIPATVSDIADYLNRIPVSPFTRADIRKFAEVWVGIDLAKSIHSGADYTAFAMVGVLPKRDERGNDAEEYHVIDLFMKRMPPPEQIPTLLRWVGDDTKITGYIPECVGYQESFAYDLGDALDKKGLTRIDVAHWTPSRNKSARLNQLFMHAGIGRLQIADIELRQTWLDQALAIDDPAEHDDLVDAVTCVHAYRKTQHLGIRESN